MQATAIVGSVLLALVQAASIPARLRQVPGPAWVSWTVPLVPGQGRICCDDCGGDEAKDRVVRLEGPREFTVFARVDKGSVGKVKTLSVDCTVDTGGLPLIRFPGVDTTESLRFLEGLVRGGSDDRRLTDEAITAIALHDDAKVDAILEGFLKTTEPATRREKASFWLGAARGRRGFEILDRVVRQDPDERFRDKVVFALSISREPEAVDSIVRIAKTDASTRVRGQALFWLGQKAGKKATDAITDAIESDPDTDVKKKAVFALSQLPHSEGVPLLIQQARTNKNPAVRKQAMFWLGQSGDSRALAFFEELLKR